MHSTQLKDYYQTLIGLLTSYKQPVVSSSSIKETLTFSDHVIKQIKENPDVWFAQTQFNKPHLPYSLNLISNTVIYTAVMGMRNHINDSCLQQLICASISLLATNINATEYAQRPALSERGKAKLEAIAQALQSSSLDVWAHCIKLAKITLFTANNKEELTALRGQYSHILAIAFILATQQTQSKSNAPLSFARLLSRVLLMIPDHWHQYVETLLLYPTTTPPGTLIQTHIMEKGTVVNITHEGCVACFNDGSTSYYKYLHKDAIARQSTIRQCNSFALFNRFWNAELQHWQQDKARLTNELPIPISHSTFKMDAPPTVIKDIQASIRQKDVDMDKLAELISKEQSLVQHLTLSASQASRNKLPVSDVKHGLMMHGYIKTNSLLLQQALLLRLNQRYFPLQETFIQFTRLRAQIAELLMELKEPMLKEEASTLACFATSGLFSVPILKGTLRWLRQDHSLYSTKALSIGETGDNIHNHSVKMSESWDLPPMHILALRNHDIMPNKLPAHKVAAKLSVTLGLSLILSRQIYFAEHSHCQKTQAYLSAGLAFLDLHPRDLPTLCEKAIALYPVFSPLNT
ncbi:HDOD domain-containing protein [Aestuariibacter sp. AA17]|uniref:HDOD domain-containing protein n=1 Tax=Fluctibacter corallii TaxID=2984329 RepID=A0ABT3A3K7_9ALTE|nr:HDOD domain-containing protein [Aestuariibacter sp. AA17]MCV2883266.1 HDOD domain-containing protein [Aestuariibacter sp. AA17]